MQVSQYRNTDDRVGPVWIDSFDANRAGTYLQKTLNQVLEDCGSCSDCLPGWTRLTNGYAELVTLLRDMTTAHASHGDTTNDAAGIDKLDALGAAARGGE